MKYISLIWNNPLIAKVSESYPWLARGLEIGMLGAIVFILQYAFTSDFSWIGVWQAFTPAVIAAVTKYLRDQE